MSLRILVPVLLVGGLAGCSGGYNRTFDAPTPVKGKAVLANGQPVYGVRVTFTPLAGKGKETFADVARDGTFVLSTFRPQDGAVPGQYVVTFDASPEARRGTRVPKKYEDVDTSIKADVQPGQDNVFE